MLEFPFEEGELAREWLLTNPNGDQYALQNRQDLRDGLDGVRSGAQPGCVVPESGGRQDCQPAQVDDSFHGFRLRQRQALRVSREI